MSIGDVSSNARGSGARFNDGKPELSLIPLHLIADSFPAGPLDGEVYARVKSALHWLGLFQTTGNEKMLDRAIEQLRPYWVDCARVFDYGRKKYAEWNWAKGMKWSVALSCAGRHALYVLRDHEFDDQESKLPHVGHMLCNLVMLRTFIAGYPEGKDLPDPSYFNAPPALVSNSEGTFVFRGNERHCIAGLDKLVANDIALGNTSTVIGLVPSYVGNKGWDSKPTPPDDHLV